MAVRRFYCICRNNGGSDSWACEMAVDTCTSNYQGNLNSFLSWSAYRNHIESNAGILCLAMVQTVIFVRLPHCGCVDMPGCLLCL